MSFILAYIVKFKLPFIGLYLWDVQIGEIQHHAQIEPYIGALWVIVTASILGLMSAGAYRQNRGVLPTLDESINVLKGMTLSVWLLLMIQFFFDVFPGSRMVIVYFWGLSVTLLCMMRWVIHGMHVTASKKGYGVKKTVVFGSSPLSQDVAERMVMYPYFGYFLVGFLDDAPPEKIHYHLAHRFTLLGSVETFESVINTHAIDAVFLVKRDLPQRLYRDIQAFCLTHNIELNLLTESILDTPFTHIRTFDGIPIISMARWNDQWLARGIKRLMDVVLAILALIAISPLFALAMLWIRWVSPQGPVFYGQTRVGYQNKPFTMLKFRSMIPDAETGTGPVMVDESGDDRYIRGGKFMRQFSIDEWPQLINVIKGDMSLVGPRPERPHFVAEFSGYIPLFTRRHDVPVGITGWAQINGRSVLTRRPEHKVKYDFYYINNWSLLLDLKIVLKTIFVVFSREESY